jgi:hypothetical protein
LVQDEIKGVVKGQSIRWNMITQASVEISKNGKQATLKIKDKKMTVKLLSPSDAVFSTCDATTKMKEENQNEGYQRLIIDCISKAKNLTIATQFVPGSVKSGKCELKALKEWSK